MRAAAVGSLTACFRGVLLAQRLPPTCTTSPPPLPADVGAGYGLLSLAAAARGHRVHAFELGPASLEALEASLQHNGFEHLVQVRPATALQICCCCTPCCCAAAPAAVPQDATPGSAIRPAGGQQ